VDGRDRGLGGRGRTAVYVDQQQDEGIARADQQQLVRGNGRFVASLVLAELLWVALVVYLVLRLVS
jgi:hypothetical protein